MKILAMFTTTVLRFRRGASMTLQIRTIINRSLFDALVIWCVLFFLGEYSIYHMSAGTVYVFAPRGWGILTDAVIHIFLFTGFFIVYTLPALMVRPLLGWALRSLMFGLLVVFLAFMQFTKVVAVVETPDHKTIFYAHYPIAPRVYDRPPNAAYKRNNIVANLSFYTGQIDDLVTYPVYNCDQRGNEDLERFVKHLTILERRQ